MIRDGWEIYHGISFNCDYLCNFSNQITTLISSHANKFKGISGSRRRVLEISSLESLQNKIISKMNNLYCTYEKILKEKLRNIPYLEEVEMDNKAILFNNGPLNEQLPHRDYSSVKKHN